MVRTARSRSSAAWRRAVPALAVLCLAAPLASAQAQVALPQPLHPHPPPGGWSASFGGSASRAAAALAPAADGGAFVAGRTFDEGLGTDLWVARLDAAGALLWERTLGGAGTDEARALVATAEGGCLVAGATNSFGAGNRDAWVIALDGEGQVLWQHAIGTAGDEELVALAPSPRGWWAGGVLETSELVGDVWALELDEHGGVLWQSRFSGESDDRATAVAPAAGGGLVLVASSSSGFGGPGAPFFRPWVLRLDADGTPLWQRTYDASGGDFWSSIVPLPDGGFVAAGEVLALAFFRGDAWFVRLDAHGGVVWDRRYGDHFGTTWVDSAAGIALLPAGRLAAIASTGTAGAGGEDLWLLELDLAGGLRGQELFGSPGFDGASAIARAADGDLLVAGFLGTEALVLRRDLPVDGGFACAAGDPTDPNAWSGGLTIAAVDVVPTPSRASVTETSAPALGAPSRAALCRQP